MTKLSDMTAWPPALAHCAVYELENNEYCHYHQAVDDAVRYLKSAFWQYGTNEAKYNYTRLEFKEVSYS